MVRLGRRKAGGRRVAQLPTPSDVTPTVALPSKTLVMPRRLSYQVANVQGIGTREEQQDSFASANAMDVTLMRQEGLFAVVADGMGGMEGGGEASAITVQTMMDAFRQRDPSEDVYLTLRDAAAAANGKVFELLGTSGGSTVVACVLWKERLWYVSVGDSCLFLLRGGGLTRLNEEHNGRRDHAMGLLDQGVFDPVRAEQAEEPTAVTSFIGTDKPMQFDGLRQPLLLDDGDTLLLCSDGIGAALGEATIAHALAQQDAEAACQELDEDIRGLQDPYQDNYTGIVIRCVR